VLKGQKKKKIIDENGKVKVVNVPPEQLRTLYLPAE
jgi:hypothetical protein